MKQDNDNKNNGSSGDFKVLMIILVAVAMYFICTQLKALG